MDTQRSAGYTIVELSLFLAVSGLLVLMVLIGTGSTIQASRFTDSSRSLHAYIQKQYDDILNGVNPRGQNVSCNNGVVSEQVNGEMPGTSQCLLLGKLVSIKTGANSVQSYNIVGVEPPNPDYSGTDEELIFDFNPAVVKNTGVDTFQIPWGTSISGNKRLTTPQADVDAIAMIRSPRSNRIVTYVFKEPNGNYDLVDQINPSTSQNNISKPANFCLKSADVFSVQSLIHITGGQGQDAIRLSFNATTEDCSVSS